MPTATCERTTRFTGRNGNFKCSGVELFPLDHNKSVLVQGQLPLSRCSGKDFQEEVVAPATTAALHDDAFFARMLF